MKTKVTVTRYTKDGNTWICWDKVNLIQDYSSRNMKELLPELRSKFPNCSIVLKKKNIFNCYFEYTCDDGSIVPSKDVIEIIKIEE